MSWAKKGRERGRVATVRYQKRIDKRRKRKDKKRETHKIRKRKKRILKYGNEIIDS